MKKILNVLAIYFLSVIFPEFFLKIVGNLFCVFVLERKSFIVFQVFLISFLNRLKIIQNIFVLLHECLSLIFHYTF